MVSRYGECWQKDDLYDSMEVVFKEFGMENVTEVYDDFMSDYISKIEECISKQLEEDGKDTGCATDN